MVVYSNATCRRRPPTQLFHRSPTCSQMTTRGAYCKFRVGHDDGGDDDNATTIIISEIFTSIDGCRRGGSSGCYQCRRAVPRETRVKRPCARSRQHLLYRVHLWHSQKAAAAAATFTSRGGQNLTSFAWLACMVIGCCQA